MASMDTTFTTDGPLGILTFNRPQARNAMTWGMYDALVATCDEVDRNDAIRVLVLRGAGGKAFAAGTDISQFQSFRTPADGLRYEQRIGDVLDRLEQVTKPTIAQVEGVAAGAGCAIAVTCDLRVATPESTFGIPIARTLGNCLTGGAFSRLVDLIGPGHAKDILFTGRLLAAGEAQSIGLVNRVAPAEAIDATVRELASVIASNAPLSVRASKVMNRRLMALRRLSALDAQDLIEMCYTSADFHEGVTAFLAKRRPQWKGR